MPILTIPKKKIVSLQRLKLYYVSPPPCLVTVLGKSTHALCTARQSRRLKQLVNALKLPSSVIPKQESMQRRQHQETKNLL